MSPIEACACGAKLWMIEGQRQYFRCGKVTDLAGAQLHPCGVHGLEIEHSLIEEVQPITLKDEVRKRQILLAVAAALKAVRIADENSGVAIYKMETEDEVERDRR